MAVNDAGRVKISQVSNIGGISGSAFETYIPTLEADANIQEAFRMFYFGTANDSKTSAEDDSLYKALVRIKTANDTTASSLTSHTGLSSNVHGVGSGNSIVGTGTTQSISNKTFTGTNVNSGTITNSGTISGGTISGPTLTGTITNNATVSGGTYNNAIVGGTATVSGTLALGGNTAAITANGATISATEISYLDNIASNIQAQINSLQSQITTNTPTGTMVPYAGSTTSSVPVGWLRCDGTEYSNAAYPTLSAILGITYGGTSGSTFKVPDLRGRSPIGSGTAVGASGATAHNLGSYGGEETHTLTPAETAIRGHYHTGSGLTPDGEGAHSHLFYEGGTTAGDSGTSTQPMTIPDTNEYSSANSVRGIYFATNHRHSFSFTTDPLGESNGSAHNNMQPFTTVNFIIKY